MFIAENGSYATVYDDIQRVAKEAEGETEPKAYNGEAAFRTIMTRLKNEGVSSDTVHEMYWKVRTEVFG